MSETGQELQENNERIVHYLNLLKKQRKEIDFLIEKQEQEKDKLEMEIERIYYKLTLINKSLATRKKAKLYYDQTIEELEENYRKIVESSGALLQSVMIGAGQLEEIMDKKTETSAPGSTRQSFVDKPTSNWASVNSLMVTEKSVAEKPVAEKPMAEKHVAGKHATGKHAAEKHATGKHAAEKHAAEKHAAEKPIVEQPVTDRSRNTSDDEPILENKQTKKTKPKSKSAPSPRESTVTSAASEKSQPNKTNDISTPLLESIPTKESSAMKSTESGFVGTERVIAKIMESRFNPPDIASLSERDVTIVTPSLIVTDIPSKTTISTFDTDTSSVKTSTFPDSVKKPMVSNLKTIVQQKESDLDVVSPSTSQSSVDDNVIREIKQEIPDMQKTYSDIERVLDEIHKSIHEVTTEDTQMKSKAILSKAVLAKSQSTVPGNDVMWMEQESRGVSSSISTISGRNDTDSDNGEDLPDSPIDKPKSKQKVGKYIGKKKPEIIEDDIVILKAGNRREEAQSVNELKKFINVKEPVGRSSSKERDGDDSNDSLDKIKKEAEKDAQIAIFKQGYESQHKKQASTPQLFKRKR